MQVTTMSLSQPSPSEEGSSTTKSGKSSSQTRFTTITPPLPITSRQPALLAPFASVPFTVSIVDYVDDNDDHHRRRLHHHNYHKDGTTAATAATITPTPTTTSRTTTADLAPAVPVVVATPSPPVASSSSTTTITTRPPTALQSLRPCPVSSTSLSLSLSTTSRPDDEETDDGDGDDGLRLDLVGGGETSHHLNPNNYLLPALALPSLDQQQQPDLELEPTAKSPSKQTDTTSRRTSTSSTTTTPEEEEEILMNNNSIIDDRSMASPHGSSSHVGGLGFVDFDHDAAAAYYQDDEQDDVGNNSSSSPTILADQKSKMVAWNKLLNCFFCTEPHTQPDEHHRQINNNNNKKKQHNERDGKNTRNRSNKTKEKNIENEGINQDDVAASLEENGVNFQHDKNKSEFHNSNVFRRSFGGALRRMIIRRHSSESLMMDAPVLEIKEDNEDESTTSWCSNRQEEDDDEEDELQVQKDQNDDGQHQQQQVQYPHHHQQQQPNQQYLYHNVPPFYQQQQLLLQQQQQQPQILYHHQNPHQVAYTMALMNQGNLSSAPPQNPFLHFQQQQQQLRRNPDHYLHNDNTRSGKDHKVAGDVCGTSVVSDFTESETSSYLSFSDDEEDDVVMGQGRNLQESDKRNRGGRASGLITNRQSAFRLPGSINNRTYKNRDIEGEAEEHNTQNLPESSKKSNDIPESMAMNSSSAKATNASLSRPPIVSTRATTIAATASYDADTSALNLDKTIMKPPSLSSRSRSDNNGNKGTVIGLPPLMPSSSGQLDGHSLARSNSRRRCDTGDETFITRTSFTTTGSRHRRDKQFAFSDDSLSEIWKEEWAVGNENSGSRRLANVPPPPPPPPLPPAAPPSYVTFQDTSRTHVSRASYISALAMSSSFGTSGRSFDSDVFEDDGNEKANDDSRIHLIREDDSSSPFAELERKLADDTNLSCHESTQEDSNENKTKTHSSPILSDGKDYHRYLRKNIALDETTEGQVVISGWLAAAFSDDPNFGSDPEEQVIPDSFPSSPNDIFYLRIVVMKDGWQAKLLLQRSSSGGEIEHSFTIHSGWVCQSRDTTRSMGRCVLVRFTENDGDLPGETASAQDGRSPSTSSNTSSLVLLPVSLDSSFYDDDKALVSNKKFLKLRENLFPTDRAGYAPDEQVDSAMHVIFTLDSLIKRYGIGSPPLGY